MDLKNMTNQQVTGEIIESLAQLPPGAWTPHELAEGWWLYLAAQLGEMTVRMVYTERVHLFIQDPKLGKFEAALNVTHRSMLDGIWKRVRQHHERKVLETVHARLGRPDPERRLHDLVAAERTREVLQEVFEHASRRVKWPKELHAKVAKILCTCHESHEEAESFGPSMGPATPCPIHHKKSVRVTDTHFFDDEGDGHCKLCGREQPHTIHIPRTED